MSSSERTCVGCGAAVPRDELERFVFVDDVGLLHDVRRKAPGRGVWVHPLRACLEEAATGGLSRGFKRQVDAPDAEELAESMRAGVETRLGESFGVAMRSGDASIGGEALAAAMRNDEVTLVFIACDAGESTRRKFASNADRKGLRVIAEMEGATLGSYLGRDFVAVAGFAERAAERLSRDVRHLRGLDR